MRSRRSVCRKTVRGGVSVCLAFLILAGPATPVSAVTVEAIQQVEREAAAMRANLEETRTQSSAAQAALDGVRKEIVSLERRLAELQAGYERGLVEHFRATQNEFWEAERVLLSATMAKREAEVRRDAARSAMESAHAAVDARLQALVGVSAPAVRGRLTADAEEAKNAAVASESAYWDFVRAVAVAAAKEEQARNVMQAADHALKSVGEKAPELMAGHLELTRQLEAEASLAIAAEKQRRLLAEQNHAQRLEEELTKTRHSLEEARQAAQTGHATRFSAREELAVAIGGVSGEIRSREEYRKELLRDHEQANAKVGELETAITVSAAQSQKLRADYIAQKAEMVRQEAEAERLAEEARRLARQQQREENAQLRMQRKLEKKAHYAALGPQWRFGAGPAYRLFDKVAFSQAPFRNWGNQNADDTFVLRPGVLAGSDGVLFGGGYGVQDVRSLGVDGFVRDDRMQGLRFDNNAATDVWVVLDYMRFDGASDDIDGLSGNGIALSLDRKILTRDEWTLRVVGNLQYFQPSSSVNHDGNMNGASHFTVEQYRHTFADSENDANVNPTGIAINPASGQRAAPSATVFSVDDDFDMDLIVLDIGLSLASPRGRWGWELGGGPTVSLVPSMDTSQDLFVRWQDTASTSPPPFNVGTPQNPAPDPPVVIPGGTHRERRSDSTSDMLFGLYLSAGVNVALTKRTDLSARLRHDMVFGSVRTDLARVDLDSLSLQFLWSYRF